MGINMNEVQRGLFNLLVEVDTLCKENGIEYYLAGGAALGALRSIHHKRKLAQII